MSVVQTASSHARAFRQEPRSRTEPPWVSARRLMELFYSNLWERGLDEADALSRAKVALREEGAPVRDWAAWVLTGNPR